MAAAALILSLALQASEPPRSGFRVRDGLVATIFAEQPMLASPVAIDVAPDGTVFVTETRRRKTQNLDIRDNSDWIDTELALRSVAEKEAFYRATLTPERSAENQGRVADYNGDGSHDWRDLSILPDRIHRICDLDGDGRADEAGVFTDDLRGIVAGVAAGVLWHRGELYVTQCPDLWSFTDQDGDGIGDTRRSVAEGFGVHIAYGGHNMHGLVAGPDGYLYWSIGDIASDHQPEEGAIFRCLPDGSAFEVFARGLRNPQELAFDDLGELHTADNDGDMGDRERWYHLLEGADYGWRISHQFQSSGWGSPTGDHRVWMEERLWEPRFPGQAAYVMPPVALVADGPCGLAHYPGLGWGEGYKDIFALAHFRGGMENSGVRLYALEPEGASFRMLRDEELCTGVAATGLAFGPDGALYVADWIGGWSVKDEGRVHRVSAPALAADARMAEAQRLLAEGMSERSTPVLQELLGSAHQRVRLEAQWELAERGGPAVPGLLALARGAQEGVARLHAVWTLGQLGREDPSVLDRLVPLLDSEESEVRAQTARVLGDARHVAAEALLLERMWDPAPRVVYRAAQALARMGTGAALSPALELLAWNGGRDLALRHAATRVLERCADAPTLAGLRDHVDVEVRLAAVVALRRQRAPQAGEFLRDPNELVVLEAARAVHDLALEPALPTLAELCERPLDTLPLARRVLDARFDLGRAEDARALARFSVDGAQSEAMRVEALRMLMDWESPSPRDRVTGAWQPVALAHRSQEDARAALEAHLSQALLGPPAVQEAAALAARTLAIAAEPTRLLAWVRDESRSRAARLAALELLAQQEAPEAAAAMGAALESSDGALRARALQELALNDPARATELAAQALAQRPWAESQPLFAALALVEGPALERFFARALERLARGELAPQVELDLREAAARRGSPELDELLARVATARDAGDPLAERRMLLVGGDSSRGRALFLDGARTQCLRCHAFGELDGRSSPEVGPDLSELADRRGRRHLLWSILEPDRELDVGFDRERFWLVDETVLVGRVVDQTPESLTILGVDESNSGATPALLERIHVPRDRIETRQAAPSAMPAGLADSLTPAELRDLIAFLCS